MRESVSGIANAPVTTYVGNAFFEKVVEGATTKWKHYLAGPDGRLGVVTRTTSGASTVYWHKDHLDSVAAEVDRATGRHPSLPHGGAFIVWTKDGQIASVEANADGDGAWPLEAKVSDFVFVKAGPRHS